MHFTRLQHEFAWFADPECVELLESAFDSTIVFLLILIAYLSTDGFTAQAH
jgi:hypothetical protein